MEDIIEEYPKNENITIYFDNMDSYTQKNDIINFFSNNNQRIKFKYIEIYPGEEDNLDGHSGSGHVVVTNKKDALTIIKKHE